MTAATYDRSHHGSPGPLFMFLTVLAVAVTCWDALLLFRQVL